MRDREREKEKEQNREKEKEGEKKRLTRREGKIEFTRGMRQKQDLKKNYQKVRRKSRGQLDQHMQLDLSL